jgi:hypothetical protein
MTDNIKLILEKWNHLRQSGVPGEFIRLDAESPLAQYCGVAAGGGLQFLSLSTSVPVSLVGTKVIKISQIQKPDGKHSQLFELTDSSFEREFLTLCGDIYAAAMSGSTEVEALARQAKAFQTWSKFFQPSQKLSMSSARGLFAELLTLKNQVIPKFGPSLAIESWKGPLGGHQDFQFSDSALEVKSINLGATSTKISSEYQLSFPGQLRLRVYAISTFESGPEGSTLANLVSEISSTLETEARALFAELLSFVGFNLDEPLCTETKFVEVGVTEYEVLEGFPAILPSDLRVGVSKVSYEISLATIAAFERQS